MSDSLWPPWTVAAQASLSLNIYWGLPKFMFIASEMLSSHLILWHPLLLLPSIFSSYRDFTNELSVHIIWPKYWSFSISPSSEYSGLISLKIDWFDLLAVQGIFRNLLQQHSLKASVINSLAFCLLYGSVFTTVCDHWEDHQLSSVQLLSLVRLFAIPWTAARQASLSITNSWSLPRLISTESVMPSNHLILCRPFLPPSVFPSIRVFSNESVLHIRGPKYWCFSFNIIPSNEYSGLISFRMDWLDLLAVQGTLKSLLEHHRSKASILRCSAYFIVKLSCPHMTIGKTIALTRWTFVDKFLCFLICCSGWS